jgi:hypothetical protein
LTVTLSERSLAVLVVSGLLTAIVIVGLVMGAVDQTFVQSVTVTIAGFIGYAVVRNVTETPADIK